MKSTTRDMANYFDKLENINYWFYFLVFVGTFVVGALVYGIF